MSAIENIRRDLREASYLRYSPIPFAGAIHDFKRPIRERFKSREYAGPYYWTPSKPGDGADSINRREDSIATKPDLALIFA